MLQFAFYYAQVCSYYIIALRYICDHPFIACCDIIFIPCGLASVSRDAGGLDYRLIPWHLPHILIASLHHISVANHIHGEALIPVFLLCCDTLGAKVRHAVDQAVDLARVSLCDCLQIQSSFSSSPSPL